MEHVAIAQIMFGSNFGAQVRNSLGQPSLNFHPTLLPSTMLWERCVVHVPRPSSMQDHVSMVSRCSDRNDVHGSLGDPPLRHSCITSCSSRFGFVFGPNRRGCPPFRTRFTFDFERNEGWVEPENVEGSNGRRTTHRRIA